MSRRIYITFSGATYDEITARIADRAPKLGADEVLVYDDLWLTEQPLYAEQRWAWDHHATRGFGWFIWKPYVMLHALSRCEPGDVILFTDADTYPIHDLSAIFEECERVGIMLFSAVGINNRNYCKRDAFILTGTDEPKYHDAQHAVARFFLFRKGAPGGEEFLREWLRYCCMQQANTFDESTLGPELPGFIEGRAEQAILTLLAHKHGHKLYREACQFGNSVEQDKDLYPQLFEQVGCHAGGPKPLIGSRFRNV